ncbi:hypothetical protein BKA66DRAFT_453697 [Pyrenochaeta sp. MPI-SDFR-AT-0127]|nr:hypothetical protein BKA66DRAFT_453697 [Pyrenochaeta sp. MPI-SDFR-AT-0127]
MPSKSPPSFGSQEYWDARFSSNAEPFEWLGAPTALDASIVDALRIASEDRPQFLHIGSGTSLLSFHLRLHVEDASQIHNLDYSEVAVTLGQKRERGIAGVDPRLKDGQAPTYMRWDAVNLLDHNSLLHACSRTAYSLIIDKSTSDAISCADDIYIPRPFPISVDPYSPTDLDSTSIAEAIHPLYILAVNLALVAKPRARWITLSYSNDRFPFLNASSCSSAEHEVVPSPATLWQLVEKSEVDNANQQPVEEAEATTVTHRPKVFNWLYILERTDVPLFLRGDHI